MNPCIIATIPKDVDGDDRWINIVRNLLDDETNMISFVDIFFSTRDLLEKVKKRMPKFFSWATVY